MKKTLLLIICLLGFTISYAQTYSIKTESGTFTITDITNGTTSEPYLKRDILAKERYEGNVFIFRRNEENKEVPIIYNNSGLGIPFEDLRDGNNLDATFSTIDEAITWFKANTGFNTAVTAESVAATGITGVLNDSTVQESNVVQFFPDYGAKMRDFISKAIPVVTDRNVQIRAIGTSLSLFNSPSFFVGNSIAKTYGESADIYFDLLGAPQNWELQFYSGPFAQRSRGNNGDGSIDGGSVYGETLTIFYDTEPDGGPMIVTINGSDQAPINCNGATSFGNTVTYNLVAGSRNTFSVRPGATGFSYLSGVYVDTGDRGVVFTNTGRGGTSLGNHAGTSNQTGAATPSGDLGLIETFATTTALVKPDLIIYSGPTNDGNAAEFVTNLDKAVDYAVANGSSVILVIEPINAVANTTDWATKRAAFYQAEIDHPNDVIILDWDLYMSPDLTFNPDYHAVDPQDPHPQDRGFGDPYALAGNFFLNKLNIPYGTNYLQPNQRKVVQSTVLPKINPEVSGTLRVNPILGDLVTTGTAAEFNGTVKVGKRYVRDGRIDLDGPLYIRNDGSGNAVIDVTHDNDNGSARIYIGKPGAGKAYWSLIANGLNSGGQGGAGIFENRLNIFNEQTGSTVMSWSTTTNGVVGGPTASWHTKPSTTSAASLRIPYGVRPTAPNNGDFYTDAAGVYVYLGNAWYQLNMTAN